MAALKQSHSKSFGVNLIFNVSWDEKVVQKFLLRKKKYSGSGAFDFNSMKIHFYAEFQISRAFVWGSECADKFKTWLIGSIKSAHW